MGEILILPSGEALEATPGCVFAVAKPRPPRFFGGRFLCLRGIATLIA